MEKDKPKKYFSLKTKITLLVVSFTLLTLGVIFTMTFFNIKKDLRADLKNRLINMASIGALLIDGDQHNVIKNRSDESTDTYLDIKNKLKRIRDSGTDISYVYTLRENENNDITFIVDAEEDPSQISHVGDIYIDANKFLKDNFMTISKPISESGFTTDQWGTMISGYAPFYDSNGKRSGVLGIDILASSIINKERSIIINYLIMYLFCTLISLLFGLYLSKKIIKSINILNRSIKNKETLGSSFQNDEFGELTETIKNEFGDLGMIQKQSSEQLNEKMKILERTNKLMIGRELEMIKLKKEISELKNNK